MIVVRTWSRFGLLSGCTAILLLFLLNGSSFHISLSIMSSAILSSTFVSVFDLALQFERAPQRVSIGIVMIYA